MKNQFSPSQYYDHRIKNEKGEMVGRIRIKPSGVLWAPKNAKLWRGVSIRKFAAFMEQEGKLQEK